MADLRGLPPWHRGPLVPLRAPATVMSLPVTNDASGEISHDTAFATSAGRLFRPSGLCSGSSCAAAPTPGAASHAVSVSVMPGDALLTPDSLGGDLAGQAAGRMSPSIRKFARTARRYRTTQIQAGPHIIIIITAADPLPEDLRQALEAISHAS